MALALMGPTASNKASTAASKVTKAPSKMDSKKAFEIPGLQARPYHDDELQVAFEIIDLDRHGEIGATDIRRALQLCGETEPTDAEIQEMIRLMDPDGSGSIEFAEFRRYFVDPPPLFRNFDLHRRGGGERNFEDEEEGEGEGEPLPALEDANLEETPGASPLQRSDRKKKFEMKAAEQMGDPRLKHIKGLVKGGITPEFIRHVYQSFVELDESDSGYMSFQAFCKVFGKTPSTAMREIFDAFDAEHEGELDLRQFVIGLSTFAKSGLEEKVRFAFMMYDEEQEGSVSREELGELLRALAPYMRSAHRDAHLERIYAFHNLHPNSRVSFDDVMDYMAENKDLILPQPKRKQRDPIEEGVLDD